MKILTKKVAYTCPIFIVEERQIQTIDGHKQTHWVVIRQPNVAIVALTKDKKIVLLKEIRGTKDKIEIGLPSGKLHTFEVTEKEAQTGALDELEQEAGYTTQNIELLRVWEPNSNWYERKYFQFIAWDVEKVNQRTEEGEKIEVLITDVDEAVKYANGLKVEMAHEGLFLLAAIEKFKQKALL